ncbi:MAG: site-specific integrase [Bacteroides sp.]|nr:site-specific integrase [Bacteroides sp.]
MCQERLSILFFIKRTRLLKNGEAPIRLRITYDRMYAEIQIKRSIPIPLWSQAKERSTGRDAKSKELNSYLEFLRVKIYSIHQQLEKEEKLITAKIIQERLLGKEEKARTLYTVFKEHNDKCRELIGIDYAEITVRRYDNCLKYLMETVKLYCNQDDILLKEVNGELVRNFEFYMKTQRKCQQNTVIRYMKCFKKVINLALANEWISRNPFAGIKFHEVEVHKDFLTQEEIDKIYTKEFDIPRLELVRDIFVFCCYTGLAFIDVQQLSPYHIVIDNNGVSWIRKDRQKTKNMCNIPLLAVPIQILKKYENNSYCLEKGVSLPVMCNQKMNSYLKEISDFCGIRKNLTMHTARHTFASVITLANNVSLKNVSKMLGHSSTRMTERYAKVLDQSILRDMMQIDKRLGT